MEKNLFLSHPFKNNTVLKTRIPYHLKKLYSKKYAHKKIIKHHPFQNEHHEN